ncbi:MAG: DUF3795 domain-containing protein [Bacteroidetes bacterium]|nr:DUF3795 domain-containing protein [Bacteroidota bacterium]
MEIHISCCGDSCHECAAYLATYHNDEEAKAKIARQWSTDERTFTADDITCTGCLSKDGPVSIHCKTCDVRQCVMKKNLLNCAHCGDYACEKVNRRFKRAPHAKLTLDAINVSL